MKRSLSLLSSLLLAGALCPLSIQAQTFLVSNTSDSGAGSLRQAILNANATPNLNASTPDTIIFSIRGAGVVETIQPLSQLPSVFDAVVIDGFSQGCPTGPCIEIEGSSAGFASGISINGSGSTVQGLAINNFVNFSGVQILGLAAVGNTVRGCHIGANVAGTAAAPNGTGILIGGSANQNVVGGVLSSDRNIISGNDGPGVWMTGLSTRLNQVEGNYIGTDLTGTTGLPNDSSGVLIDFAATKNVVGTGNVISGNAFVGIEIRGAGSDSNSVAGNLIGTDVTGSTPLGNVAGVYVAEDSEDNLVGGTDSGAQNIISGNTTYGIVVAGEITMGHRIQGNYVGTDKTGLQGLPNGIGVGIYSASGNTIGGSETGAGNLISGNLGHGVVILAKVAIIIGPEWAIPRDSWATGKTTATAATLNVVRGNLVGTDATGLVALPNGLSGVHILGSGAPASLNAIGGSAAGARNVISGNNSHGIWIKGDQAENNLVQNNLIGLGSDGVTPLGNGAAGVRLESGANSNEVGGNGTSLGNTIAHNDSSGVVVIDMLSLNNVIRRNVMFENGGPGIDLGNDGPTVNDPNDLDEGPNHLQNSPVLVSSSYNQPLNEVEVTYDMSSSSPGSAYPILVEFFTSDADGEEGKVFVGSDSYTAVDLVFDPIKTVSFTPASPVATTDVLVATATDDDGTENTSEFSNPSPLNGLLADLCILLEGPYAGGGKMSVSPLFHTNIPLSQPYSAALFDGFPVEYDGSESVSALPDSVIDWIVLQLRTDPAAASEVPGSRQAAFLLNDCSIVSLDGGPFVFEDIPAAPYYVVAGHRNHVEVMSSTPVNFTTGVAAWNFTNTPFQAYTTGPAPMKMLTSTRFAMFAGNALPDANIQALDFDAYLAQTLSGATGYQRADFNMDGNVQALDFNLYLANTLGGASSQVP